MNRLLVLACSGLKRRDPGRMPARDRYNGPLWRTLRAADPDGRRAKVGFLSARYGFRAADTPIEHYDARLSPELAERMIAGGMTTCWPRPPRKHAPDTFGIHPGAEIASLSAFGRAPFHDVALVGGGLYLTVMRAPRRVPGDGVRDAGRARGRDQRPDRPDAPGPACLARQRVTRSGQSERAGGCSVTGPEVGRGLPAARRGDVQCP